MLWQRPIIFRRKSASAAWGISRSGVAQSFDHGSGVLVQPARTIWPQRARAEGTSRDSEQIVSPALLYEWIPTSRCGCSGTQKNRTIRPSLMRSTSLSVESILSDLAGPARVDEFRPEVASVCLWNVPNVVTGPVRFEEQDRYIWIAPMPLKSGGPFRRNQVGRRVGVSHLLILGRHDIRYPYMR